MSRIRFSAFADLHFHPGVFYTQAEERLAAIRQRAIDNNVDFVICCGDFCHSVRVAEPLLKAYDAFPMPVHHVIGNHDSDRAPYAETLKAFHLEKGHYFFDQNGFRFIIVDTNYFLDGNKFCHYDGFNYYKHLDAFEMVPPEEIEWLRKTIDESPFPCVLFSHGSLERLDDVPNVAEILELIDAANRKCPGKVRLCINGHHHRDHFRIRENVLFMELNSTSYDYLPNAHTFYPKALTDEFTNAHHTIIYTKPVHAIVTLDTDGTIDIQGMKGEYFMGVTEEMTDNPRYDNAGRPCTPHVSSLHLKMAY